MSLSHTDMRVISPHDSDQSNTPAKISPETFTCNMIIIYYLPKMATKI